MLHWNINEFLIDDETKIFRLRRMWLLFIYGFFFEENFGENYVNALWKYGFYEYTWKKWIGQLLEKLNINKKVEFSTSR